MSENHESIKSPSKLISPSFHSSRKRAWYLIRFYLCRTPDWGSNLIKTKLCIFREIAYVDSRNELIGLGRSYLPINLFGLLTFLSCISIIDPKPIGVALKIKYGTNIKIKIISNKTVEKNLTPYRSDITEVISYKRALSVKDGIHIVLVEEDFIK
jgi:hypothetical protein